MMLRLNYLSLKAWQWKFDKVHVQQKCGEGLNWLEFLEYLIEAFMWIAEMFSNILAC